MSKHLSSTERKELELLRKKGYSFRDIWEAMKRDPWALCKERNRNKVKWVYNAKKAQTKSYQRRHWCKKQTKKIRANDQMENYVKERLIKKKWSPEKVAWRWSLEHPDGPISWITVRRYLESRFGVQLRFLIDLEKRKKKRRKRRKKENWTRQVIQHRTFIDVRPLYISTPSRPWHYEVDLILSVKEEKDCLLTLVDKFSRHKIAYKLRSKDSLVIEQKLLDAIKKHQIASMTFDNDLAFAQHHKLWILTYFCHTYSSREKGQIERANKDYRKYIPKKTKISTRTQDGIDTITAELNNEPMKCLNWHTPNEVMSCYQCYCVLKHEIVATDVDSDTEPQQKREVSSLIACLNLKMYHEM